MIKLTRIPFILIAILFCLTGCSSKLTEDKAKETVDKLLARGTELPDNSPRPAQLIEWQGLVQISETEMNGKAIIQHKDGRMTGKFIFHKSSDNSWVLDKVSFNEGRILGGHWMQEVFQKVD